MSEKHDRRAAGVNRVNVARLVDICGRDPSVPAFEAESVELSGRGMHVRTPYLPPLGAPLVCRLEEAGQEIVVEGVVAWQEHGNGGGEFGIQFTALDSGSVEALRQMCRIDAPSTTMAAPAPAAADPEPSAVPPPAGLPVKLHIDGLGAPMKARVRNGGSRKLQVGSNLEFLKVGRGLEVEDVEHGQRRGARIDAVSIAIDPETQVPQLVVALRYDGEDTTPEPSVIGAEDAAPATRAAARPVEAVPSAPPVSSATEAFDDDLDDDDDDESPALRGKVDAFAVSVGKVAKSTGEKLAVVGGSVATRFAAWAKGRGGRFAELAQRGAEKRRSTSKAPAPASSGARRLRPQNSSRDGSEIPAAPQKKKILVATAGGVTVLTLAIAVAAMGGHSSKPATSTGASPEGAGATAAAGPIAAPPAMAVAPGAAFATTGAVPNAAPGAMPGTPTAGIPGQRPGVVANVPLFGPTPMAPLEPAPLGPSPTELAAQPQALSPHPAPVEERMDEEEESKAAHDESFEDGASKKDKADKSAESKAAEVKPFSQGKMHLPVVYRMKLDKPGAALSGKAEASGFSVTIPGRKVESGGTAITKRDDRIANVRTKNGTAGAQVTFVFRGKVPSYKIRLRKSYVEFFVSSPDGAK